MKWCRPSGDVILASSWQGTDVALKQIPTPGEASGDVEPAVMALLLRKQNAPSSGRTLGLRSQGTEGLPRKSVRAQKKTRNCASLCVLGSIKAPIIPCRMEGHKTNQLPTQRPGGREELLGLIFHPDPLSVSSSRHWSHVLRSHRKQHRGGKKQCMVLTPPLCKLGPSQDLLMCLQASSRGSS